MGLMVCFVNWSLTNPACNWQGPHWVHVVLAPQRLGGGGGAAVLKSSSASASSLNAFSLLARQSYLQRRKLWGAGVNLFKAFRQRSSPHTGNSWPGILEPAAGGGGCHPPGVYPHPHPHPRPRNDVASVSKWSLAFSVFQIADDLQEAKRLLAKMKYLANLEAKVKSIKVPS